MASSDTQLGRSEALGRLDRLVGAWRLEGGAQGEVRYEWAEGGRFLFQHVDIVHDGAHHRGIEVIGHLRGLGEEPSAEIWSRFYGFLDGHTLDYVYELEGDVLTVWGGHRGSPAYFRATIDATGDRFAGAWVWPGGGYEVSASRVR
jgi:hypothetical protein